jgi:trans-2,3-dihydro-3-hydroxyanthranilate isomerase
MKKLPLIQVDAFSKTPYGGNPCAVVFDADELSEVAMQAMALEMNLSETAFVMASEVADIRARYFTPVVEIPLAGHPTIATIFALIVSGRLPVPSPSFTIQLQLEAGVIPVEITNADSDLPLITMSQIKPMFLRSYEPKEILPVFGLEKSDALVDAHIMTVSTGTPQLMIPLNSLESLKRAQLDASGYESALESGDFFSPHLFVVQGITEGGDTFARHFGLPPDTPEDPFTGSATGGMAAYLWRQGLIDQPKFVAQQGHWMGRPGEAYVEVVGPRDDIETVKVGGHAVEVMRGEIFAPTLVI